MNRKRQLHAKMDHREFTLVTEQSVKASDIDIGELKTVDPSTTDERRCKMPHRGVKGYHEVTLDPQLGENEAMLRRAPCYCPACVARFDNKPTRWPLEDVAKKPVTCAKTGETVALQAVPLNAEKVAAMTLMLDTSPLDMPEFRLSSDKVRFGKPLEAALGLAKLLGIKDLEEIERLRSREVLQQEGA